MAKGLDEQMYEILGNYDKKVEKLLIKECREVASDASEELQKTSPKKSGEYASGWVSKPLPKGAIVYNDTKPQLTHFFILPSILVLIITHIFYILAKTN